MKIAYVTHDSLDIESGKETVSAAADGLHDILYRTDCITLLRSAARRNVPQGGRLLKRGNQPFLHRQPDYPHNQRHFAIADVLFLRDAVAD